MMKTWREKSSNLFMKQISCLKNFSGRSSGMSCWGGGDGRGAEGVGYSPLPRPKFFSSERKMARFGAF